MAITSNAICNSFKKELLEAKHNFSNPGGNSFKLAMYTDFADLSFTGVTLTARGALIYNDTASGDPAVCVLDFGGDKTATAGTFTIQFPAFTTSAAILRIA